MKELQFGRMIHVAGEIIKTKESGRKTIWKRVAFKNPKPMLYIGKRTVQEGRTEYEYAGDAAYPYFIPERFISVLLFVENTRTNPVYVHPDDVLPDEA